ncbi:PIN domain-containing protein [Enterovirga aerilata]|uniref:PIN domain-containing protein n=1 Tax=Enterovirga aerilata TaxID=2730920 RepID=A0A849I245_9HYPH|nr:PIN domain-containing protein [Enterovirga sp. DB1703]NNM71418.1 PIN domain-containing protein [Enterovirga sp. DB1703]
MLILLLNERAAAPTDHQTGEPVSLVQERIKFMVQQTVKARGRLIVPTPALGEVLVKVEPESAAEYLSIMERARGFKISPFGIKAAIEFAEMQRQLLGSRRRIKRGDLETRARAKFDQQIVAIAKAEGASVIYSDDSGLKTYAKHFGLETLGIRDLPTPPPSDLQQELPLEPPEPEIPAEVETAR